MKQWLRLALKRPFPNNQPPATGPLLRRRPEDSLRDYPSAGVTPARLATILREADSGSLALAMQLYEEMEEKDAHLHAVASKRRLALTGLPWDVTSAADIVTGVDRGRADAAAAFCRFALQRIEHFEDVLQHLALALGRNIAVAELVWDIRDNAFTVGDIVPVDFTRLTFDDRDQLRILTADEPQRGIPVPPGKFIVHTPHNVSGHPTRGGLLRVSALSFLGKNLALKDWMIFAEIFGMPIRVARYDPTASAEEKREVMTMLESLGSSAAAMFSRAIELEFVESGQGKAPPPYEALVDFLNREMSKAWLGQTLTTETPGLGGTFGATRIHDEVRKDLRADDLRKEARTLRRDLLAPLARFRFGPDVPVPFFSRRVEVPRSLTELTNLLDAAVNRLGVRVPRRWAHDVLSIPAPDGKETVLPGENAIPPDPAQ